jgi:hypothetical protein
MSDQTSRSSQPHSLPMARPGRSVPLPRPADPVASRAALAQMTGYWDWEV